MNREEEKLVILKKKIDLLTNVEIELHMHPVSHLMKLYLIVNRINGGKDPGLTTEILGPFDSSTQLQQKLHAITGKHAVKRAARTGQHKTPKSAQSYCGLCCRLMDAADPYVGFSAELTVGKEVASVFLIAPLALS